MTEEKAIDEAYAMGRLDCESRGMEPQSIGTAPTDGTEILAFREDAGWFVARYAAAVEFMTSAEIDAADATEEELHEPDWWAADFIQGCRLEDDLRPTHWMPLPAPPTS